MLYALLCKAQIAKTMDIILNNKKLSGFSWGNFVIPKLCKFGEAFVCASL